MGLFSKFKNIETSFVNEVEHLEQVIVADAKGLFEKARQEALSANDEVNRLKTELQTALIKARDLHEVAMKAASDAVQQAEADVVRFKQAVIAHGNDLKTQASQIVTPPAPVATADTTDPIANAVPGQ